MISLGMFGIEAMFKTAAEVHRKFEASIEHLSEEDKESARRLYRGGDNELRHRELVAAIRESGGADRSLTTKEQ
jgi:hypothetical protein